MFTVVNGSLEGKIFSEKYTKLSYEFSRLVI